MDPFSAAIMGGSAIVGGLIGKEGQEDAQYWQDQYAKHGIQWRVDDAKAAGVHPLFALGASLPPSQPVVVDAMGQAVADAGQAVGGLMARRENAQDAAFRAAQLRAVNASAARDEAAAGLAVAEAEATRRPELRALGYPDVPLDWDSAMVELAPDAAKPRIGMGGTPVRPDYIAGPRQPGLTEFQFKGFPVLLPSVREGSGAAEALESVENLTLQAFIIDQNLRHYGHEGIKYLHALVGEKRWAEKWQYWYDKAMGVDPRWRKEDYDRRNAVPYLAPGGAFR